MSRTHTASPSRTGLHRALAAAGAVLAAAAVALSAYAAHSADDEVRSRLMTAAVFGFGHGIALAALAPIAFSRLSRMALSGLLAGTLLFSGGVTASALAAPGGGVAPFGGSLLIAAWLLYAVAALRTQR